MKVLKTLWTYCTGRTRRQRVRRAILAVLAVAIGVFLLTGRETVATSPAASPSAAGVAARTRGNPSSGSAATAAAPAAAAAPLSVRGTKTVRIVANQTITADIRRAIADFGARIIAPVGPRAVLVEATPVACARISGDSRFTTEDVLAPAKVQSALAELCEKTPDERLPVLVIGLAESDVPAISKAIVAAGGELMKVPFEREIFGAKVTASMVAELSQRGDVRWIEHSPPVKAMNDQSVRVGAANVDTIRTVHKLFGREQTVTVCDSGFDTGKKDACHADFTGRVKAILPEAGTYRCAGDYAGHGTHVSGTILGDGTCSGGQYKGMAPKAQLVMECVGDSMGSGYLWFNWTYEKIFTEGYNSYGSYIHSDSWGGNAAGSYTTTSRTLDEVLWSHPELLVVVSAGNEGSNGDCTIGAPGTAKGALTVGNTQSFRSSSSSWGLPASPENLNPSSSRGPTTDGRVKPEISAPGTEIKSTRSSLSDGYGDYELMTGTSMSCPLVSGAAALTREWLLDRRDYAAKHGGKKPTGALLKAILTGGGVIMTGEYQDYGKSETRKDLPQTRPNFCTGWGRIDLEETLYPTNGRAVLFADRVPFAHHAVWTTNVTTTADAPLDVQLVWMDYPASESVDTGKTLINDLDLVVSNRTTGAVWYGNDVIGGDRTNTTESVRLTADDAPAGEYAVMVVGHEVPYASTEGGAAAVYVRGAFPDETSPDPLWVRNVRTEKRYEFLDDALAEVEADDTLEILQPVELSASATVPVSCTIVATNADPTASLVTRVGKATLTVAAGATLSLSNVVFSDAGGTAVEVLSNGTLRVAGTVGVGSVTTVDAAGFVLAAPLVTATPGLSLACAAAKDRFAAFGTWTGAYPDASNAAARVSHATDLELGGCALEEGQTLVWDRVQPDPADALAYAEDPVQGRTYYRSLDTLLADYTNGGEIVICRDCAAERFTKPIRVNGSLVFRSPTGAAVTPSPSVSFTVPAGSSLVVSNVVIRDWRGPTLFSVEGGDLTLEDGARLENLRGEHATKTYGATYMSAGSLTMRPGAAIANCSAVDGQSFSGGGIFAEGGVLRLQGGTVTGCRALKEGAGIYAYTKGADPVRVEVSGDFVAKANCIVENEKVRGTNDLFLASATHPLAIVAPLTSAAGSIGIAYGSKDGGNTNGAPFAVLKTALSPSEGESAAAAFRNTTAGGESLVAVVSENALVWQKTADAWPEGRVDPSSSAKKLCLQPSEGVTTYWKDLALAIPHMKNGDVVAFLGSYSLTNSITLPALRLTWNVPSGKTFNRARKNVQIHVPAGAELTANASFFDQYAKEETDANTNRFHTVPFFDVSGGILTLQACSFERFAGRDARDANAVTVWNGGRLVARDTRFTDCRNIWQPEFGVNRAAGGAILVDGATAELADCTVSSCSSEQGGVAVANKGELRVSGKTAIVGNATEDDVVRNLVVERGSKLVLAGELTGDASCRIGYTEGTYGDTNTFGSVEWDWPDVTALTNNAARFFHDVTGTAGTAVTNGVDKAAKLVWSDWLSRAGAFVDGDGTEYRIFLAAGQYVASPVKYGTPSLTLTKQDALAASGSGDREKAKTLAISISGVKGCWYTLRRADALAADAVFTAVETKQAVSDGPVSFEAKMEGDGAFWKIVAEEGLAQ